MTNKSMGEGLEMVGKIKQEKIEEILKKLEFFSMGLQKYLDKDFVNKVDNEGFKNSQSIQENSLNGLRDSQFLEDDARDALLKNNSSNNNLDSLQLGGINNNSFNLRGINSSNQNSFSYQNLNQDGTKIKRRYGTISSNAMNGRGISDGYNLVSNKKMENKKLSILSFSYFQIIGIIINFVLFLLLIFFCTYSMIRKTNQILQIESFFLGKSLVTSSNTINIKCEMALCDIGDTRLNFTSLITQEKKQTILQWILNQNFLNYYYEKLYMSNACLASFNITEYDTMNENSVKIYNDPLYKECMNDVLIKSANNTEGLNQLVENKVNLIRNDIKLNQMKNPNFSPYEMFYSDNFYIFEKAFYKYLIKINDNFETVIKEGLEKHLNQMGDLLVIVMVIFGCSIALIGVYIGFFLINKLIHLLSVSRCILKIIPTNVINNTQELENWIENKY